MSVLTKRPSSGSAAVSRILSKKKLAFSTLSYFFVSALDPDKAKMVFTHPEAEIELAQLKLDYAISSHDCHAKYVGTRKQPASS